MKIASQAYKKSIPISEIVGVKGVDIITTPSDNLFIRSDATDLTGEVFGKLTVIGFAGKSHLGLSLWLCQCDCGEKKIILQQHLSNGRSRTCGGAAHRKDHISTTPRKYEDLTGRKFGRLTVIKRVPNPRNNGPRWLCACDCGKTVHTNSGTLKYGEILSCGCKRIKHGLSGTEEYKKAYRIIRRERETALDSEWSPNMQSAILYLFPKCVWCGSKNNLCVDHVYPLSRGYGLKPGNATVLCSICNSSKSYKMPEEIDDDRRELLFYTADEFKNYWDLLSGCQS